MTHRLMIAREDRVLRLTLNNPDKHNALDETLCCEITGALEDAARDRQIGAILLDAAGKNFCAGMDLSEALQPGAAELTEIHERLFTAGLTMNKPVVAAVQGAALGGAVGLLANCHVVLAAQGASFGLTEMRVGMWPFVIWRALAVSLGERRAVELALTARIFGTTEALQYGLVHEVTPPFELEDRATATARHLAYSSQATLQRGLAFVQQTRGLSWTEAGALARRERAEVFVSADFIEGARAFRERRKPDWPSLRPTK